MTISKSPCREPKLPRGQNVTNLKSPCREPKLPRCQKRGSFEITMQRAQTATGPKTWQLRITMQRAQTATISIIKVKPDLVTFSLFPGRHLVAVWALYMVIRNCHVSGPVAVWALYMVIPKLPRFSSRGSLGSLHGDFEVATFLAPWQFGLSAW